MSFYSTSDTIAAGDTVIVYSSRQQIQPLVVQPGLQLQSRYGQFKHEEMVGVTFGSKFASANGRGFVYLLKPTPELWTLALPHRTQILYLPDIAFITSYLDIKAGSRVIEAGTGSGSFSHSIARSVGSTGRVHSFEFHEERFTKAKEEFLNHGLNDTIKLKHQNVYKDGFELKDEVDSVFLDLPAPWEAIGHAKEALRKDRQARICCFSPCIEQVLRTVSALSDLGFSDITMYEALTRDHEPATSFLPDVSMAIERIQGHEAKKERRREGQLAEAQKRREEKERAALKRKHEEAEGTDEGTTGEGGHVKKAKGPTATVEEDVSIDEVGGSTTNASTPARDDIDASVPPTNVSTKASAAADSKSKHQLSKEPPVGNYQQSASKYMTFRAGSQTRGHTSYLTFATLLPQTSDDVGESAAGAATGPKVGGTAELADVTAEEDEFPLEEGDAEALLAVDLSAVAQST